MLCPCCILVSYVDACFVGVLVPHADVCGGGVLPPQADRSIVRMYKRDGSSLASSFLFPRIFSPPSEIKIEIIKYTSFLCKISHISEGFGLSLFFYAAIGALP